MLTGQQGRKCQPRCQVPGAVTGVGLLHLRLRSLLSRQLPTASGAAAGGVALLLQLGWPMAFAAELQLQLLGQRSKLQRRWLLEAPAGYLLIQRWAWKWACPCQQQRYCFRHVHDMPEVGMADEPFQAAAGPCIWRGCIVLAAAMIFCLLLQASPAQKQAATVATQTSPHLLHSALPPSASGKGSIAGSYSEPRPKRPRAAREVEALQVCFHLALHAQRTLYPAWGRPCCVLRAAADTWLPVKSRSLARFSSRNSSFLLPAMQVITVTCSSRCLMLTDVHEQCFMPLPAHRPVLTRSWVSQLHDWA